VKKAKSQGADIIKIAAMARDAEDVARLMCFTAARSENMVSIAMGEHGAISRIIAPLFGSLFTYAFVDKAVAPGQIPLEELVKELKKYYPGFNESNRHG
jgi:3-dehydroquinate dehydratase-1